MYAWLKNSAVRTWIILGLCLIISGIIGTLFVQSPNFDFYTYHYHSGWAFLNNRISVDFMPCQSRSYFNPLLNAINFILIEKFNNHPYVYLFFTNFKYGFFIFLTYLISDFIFKDKETKLAGILSTIFMVILSPIILFTMRLDFNDIQIANLVLISFYIFIRFIFQDNSTKKLWMMFTSALILGLGIGLKYSIIIFALPLVICTFIYLKKDSAFWKTILLMLFGGILGLVISDGWWLYIVWSHFKNPLFPYFNNIFKSPYADINAILTSEYAHLKPNSLYDFIFAPLKDTIANEFVGHETPYYEPKMVLSFLAVVCSLFIYKISAIKERLSSIIDLRFFTISIIFLVVGYYGNAAIYGTLRYVMALAVISSYVIIALSLLYCKTVKTKKVYPVLIFVLIWSCMTFYFQTNTWIVDQKIKSLISVDRVIIKPYSTILCGNQTACAIAPHLNQSAKYVAFTIPNAVSKKYSLYFENETDYKNYYYHSDYLENKVKEAFEKADNLYIVFNPYGFSPDGKIYKKSVEYYSKGKIKSFNSCKFLSYSFLSTSKDGIYICKLK